MNNDKYTDGELFNLISGSSISGESTYDLWKSLAGNEDKTASDFFEFLRANQNSGSAGVSSWNHLEDKPFGEKIQKEYFPLIEAQSFTLADGESSIVLSSNNITLQKDYVYEATINDDTFIMPCKFIEIKGAYLGGGAFERFDVWYIGNIDKYKDDSVEDYLIYFDEDSNLIFKPKTTDITSYTITLTQVNITKLESAYIDAFQMEWYQDDLGNYVEGLKLKADYIPSVVVTGQDIPNFGNVSIRLWVFSDGDVNINELTVNKTSFLLNASCIAETQDDNRVKYIITTPLFNNLRETFYSRMENTLYYMSVTDQAHNYADTHYSGARLQMTNSSILIEFANNVVVEISA